MTSPWVVLVVIGLAIWRAVYFIQQGRRSPAKIFL